MTLRHIKIFVTICETGSVTAAAKKLFIAQPSISLAITELENHYQIKLFDRVSRKLQITDAGKKFLDYATHIISLYEEMEDNMRRPDASSDLRIGSSITIGTRFIPKLVKHFSKICPSVKVHVTIDNSEKIECHIMNGEIDFGLIEGIAHEPRIEVEKFMDDELVLICGKGHPVYEKDSIKKESLPKFDFILREKGSGTRELFDSTMMINNIAITPVWESISTRAIISAVSEGLGLSVLPYRLVEQDLNLQNIKCIPIKGISFKRSFFLIYHVNKFFTEPAKIFTNELKNTELITIML